MTWKILASVCIPEQRLPEVDRLDALMHFFLVAMRLNSVVQLYEVDNLEIPFVLKCLQN